MVWKPSLLQKGPRDSSWLLLHSWEQREFENFAQRKSEMGNSSSAPCVEYEDIIADQGRLNKDVFQKRSHKTGIKFSAGDVLFGKLRPYLKNWLLPDFSGVAVGDFWVLKPSGTDSRFLYYLIQTSEFFSVSNQSAGSKMPRADWNLVSQYAFHIPGEENEQQKIGSLFRRIDALITLHQRVYFQRRKNKNCLRQKITFAWEQRKLASETTEIIAGGDVEKTILKEKGNFPVIANALTNDGVVGYYEYSFRVKAPAVTVTGRGDVGHAKARVVDFTPVVRLLSLKSRHDVFFMENAINNMRIVIESTGVPQLTVPQLSQYEIFYPQTILEEKKIGQFFRALDQLITLHQREYLLFEVLLC